MSVNYPIACMHMFDALLHISGGNQESVYFLID